MTLLKVDLTRKLTCRNCNTVRPAGSTACSSCGAALLKPDVTPPDAVQQAPVEKVTTLPGLRAKMEAEISKAAQPLVAPIVAPAVATIAAARPAMIPIVQLEEELQRTHLPTQFLSEGQDFDMAHEGYNEGLFFLKQYGKDGEEIELVVTSIEPGGESVAECAIATDKRIIVYKKMSLGRLKIDDCLWQDVFDIAIQDGGNRITLVMKTLQDEELMVEGLSQQQGRALVKYCSKRSEKIRNKVKALDFDLQISGPLPPGQPEAQSISRPLPASEEGVQIQGPLPVRVAKSTTLLSSLEYETVSDPDSGSSTKLQASVHSVLVTNKAVAPQGGSILQNVMKAASEAQAQTDPRRMQSGSFLQDAMRASHAQQGANTSPMSTPPPNENAFQSIMRSQSQSDPHISSLMASGPMTAALLQSGPITQRDFAPAPEPQKEVLSRNADGHGSPESAPEVKMSSGSLASGTLPPVSAPIGAAERPSQPLAQQPVENAPSQNDLVHKMKQLKGLLDAELISQEEYNQKRLELLARI